MEVCKEQQKRSIAKCISWRTVAFADTAVLSLVFTGSIANALAIGTAEIATKSVFYYLHERAWLSIACWLNRRYTATTFSDTKLYSGLKTISWRVVGSVDTFILALVITGDLVASSSIGVAEIFTKVFLYYSHERIWVRIPWGKAKAEPLALLPAPRAQNKNLLQRPALQL